MKKFDFWFLLRFMIITAMYSLECILLQTNLLILDPRFFPLALFLFLAAILCSFFFNEKIKLQIKLITDIVFLGLFTLGILIAFFMQFTEHCDGILGSACLFLELPMVICFIVWLVRDTKRLGECIYEGGY